MKNCECGSILERQEKAMLVILECPDCLYYETVEETERNKQLQRDWAEVVEAQEADYEIDS